MRRVVVVGGGIAGLAAAWAARSASDGLVVRVLEQGDMVGGKARTISRDGWLVEGGPTGFLSGTPEMDRLIAACGSDLTPIPANAAAARRFILVGGRMRRATPNPVALVSSGLLSVGGMLRLLADLGIPAKRDGSDESIWAFASRRIGSEAADRLIAPMTLGVFAGDARHLSLAAAFPRMSALEREHGSLIRGMIARRGRISSGALTSFAGGMQALPGALAAHGGFQIDVRTAATRIVRAGKGWEITHSRSSAPLLADAIILAVDPAAAAALLREHDGLLAAELESIPCPPVAVVALGYGPQVQSRIPIGFGVLIARGEGYRMLGNLWDSQLFPNRAPDGHVLIRAMYGGGVDAAAASLPPGELANLARGEVARLYGLDATPVFEQVVQWPMAIPQYQLGHLERVKRIDGRTAALQGIFLTGSALHGVAFPAAAAHGVQTGERAVKWLSARAAEPHQ